MARAKKADKSQEEKSEPVALPASIEPLRAFFEKKLRNLEKRKGKLDGYKQLEREGKLTDPGQQQAVSKYNEVLNMISMVAEIQLEMMPIIREAGTTVAKELSLKDKEAVSKSKYAIRSILDVQDIFDQLGEESVRFDFVNGNGGASPLTTEQIDAIDELYGVSKPSRSRDTGVYVSTGDYNKSLKTSTEEFYRLVTRSATSFSKTTLKYEDLSDMFTKIGGSPYFNPEEREKLTNTQANETEEIEVEQIHVEPVSEEPPPTLESDSEPLENGHDTADMNGERKRTPYEVLGSLQQKSVISFVQDDVERNENEDPAVIVAHPMVPGSLLSRNPPFPSNSLATNFEESQYDSFSLRSSNLDQNYTQFSNNDSMYNMTDVKTMQPEAPHQKVDSANFTTQQSWADEVAGDSFETHLNSPDNFVEVKYSQRGNVRGGNGRGDFKVDGRGRYPNDFRGANRGPRGGFEANGRGIDSGARGSFNRPYRNDYPRDAAGPDGGAVYRRDDMNRNRSFPAKQDAQRGQTRGGRARNFDRPYNQGRE
jgi:hypothetical protein